MGTIAPSIEDFPLPKFVEGGCLCGSLRYRVDFPEDHDFKKSSGTCQCTQCRKQSGSLFWPLHQLKPASALTWKADATLKIYKASADAERAFCSNCGSCITWRSTDQEKDAVEFAIGTVDEIYLIGEGGVEKVHTAADGEQQTIPKTGFGFAIANGMGSHSWTENEILGVTDGMLVRGQKLKH
ncbi:hypothetical protein NKR19_g1383 [Coniochaeta hoffmannii]|uniref:CENP-V/GFA domain-containing protein n=1 Tax=Coniochaeta hoffmannii TaxID=91930 RepID=A0AA38W3C8_9PEZI|nr:hypothetical protein NKR19_g1383 [Coniochaeta hoffmannii]